MERHRRHLAVLRQCPYRTIGNVRSRNRRIQHKDEWLALLFNRLDHSPCCPEAMRPGPTTRSASARVWCGACVKDGGVPIMTFDAVRPRCWAGRELSGCSQLQKVASAPPSRSTNRLRCLTGPCQRWRPDRILAARVSRPSGECALARFASE